MTGDEQVRARVMAGGRRRALDLTADECWTLLGGVPVGRVVFTMEAMPAIRPVNHLVDGKTIVVRSHLGSAITGYAGRDGAMVCYEADELDPLHRTGWSVMVTGAARLVQDAVARARYECLLTSWSASRMEFVIAIEPAFISGIRLVA